MNVKRGEDDDEMTFVKNMVYQ